MVIQDPNRPPVPVQPALPKKEKTTRRLSVVGVQCIACVVVLLLALLLRGAGGSAYQQLRRTFQDCLMRNDLMVTLAVLWDGDPLQRSADGEPPAQDTPSTSSTTPGTSTTTPSTSATTPGATTTTSGTGTTASSTTTTSSTSTTVAGTAVPAGTVAVPLRVSLPANPPLPQGRVTSAYGYRENPTGEGTQFHRGVDIAAPAGTPIAALYSGRVIKVGEDNSLGRYVQIEHGDGVQVLYAHCSRVLVAEQTVVRGGERVALVGATGNATGNHVHVQVTCNGVVYDPSVMVGATRYV